MRYACVAPLLLSAVAATTAQAASPVRLVEAVATSGWKTASRVRIEPAREAVAKDPHYPVLAADLAASLEAAGVHVAPSGELADAVVKLDYTTKRFGYTQGVNDPSYRAVVVTALAADPASAAEPPRVVWRTAFEQTGILTDAQAILPPMLKAAEAWYGRNLTPVRLGRPGVSLSSSSSRAYGTLTWPISEDPKP